MLTLWALKSAAIYGFFRYVRQFDNITFVDSVKFPLNRKALVHKFGEYHLEMARAALERQDYRSALTLLRSGLARSPDNRDGRLALASLYRMMKDEDNTVSLLKRGLDFHADDPLYLKVCLQTLLTYRRDAEIMDYADARLANVSENPSVPERMVAYVAAQVFEEHGNFARTIAYLNDYKLTDTEEGCMLLSKAYWTCEKRDQAIQLLKRFLIRHPGVPSVGVHKMLCTYLHQTGRDSDAMISSLSVVNDDPKSYNARKDLIEAYHNLGQNDKANWESRRYLMDFPDKAEALLLLGDYATSIPDADLANEIYYTAAEQGFNMGIFGLLMIESNLSAGNFAKSADYCQQLIDEAPIWLSHYEPQINFLRAASARGLRQDSMASLYLTRVLESKLAADDLLAMGRRMQIGRAS
ncbi:MAG: tetratricopeptide repeat protein, partial [Opitutales bacterium]